MLAESVDMRGPLYTVSTKVPCFVSLGIYFSKSPRHVFMISYSFEIVSFLKTEHGTLGIVHDCPLTEIPPLSLE